MEFSILDIAQKAGVSKSTISRVINGGSVSPKTRKIVEDTMREMGYSPNYMARGLRGVHNTVVGILSLGSSMFSHPSISRRIAGILDTLGKTTATCSSSTICSSIARPRVCAPSMCAICGIRDPGTDTLGWDDLPEVQQAANQFRNVVYGGERLQMNRGFRVYHGNYYYSADLYHLLVMNGHRRILTTVGFEPQDEQFRRARMRAWESTCLQAGIPYDEDSFYRSPMERTLTEEYLSGLYRAFRKGKYTALFADEMSHATAILLYFREKGLRCPEDLFDRHDQAGRRPRNGSSPPSLYPTTTTAYSSPG